MYDKCYFCLDQLPKLKKESTASFFVNFGGAGVQKSRPTLLYKSVRLPCESATTGLHYRERDADGRDGRVPRDAERGEQLLGLPSDL